MINSVKSKTYMFFLIATIVAIISVSLTLTYIYSGNINITINVVYIVFVVLAIGLSLLLARVLYKSMFSPIKKIEKTMRSVADGKMTEIRPLKNNKAVYEMEQFIGTFNDMMHVIKKNHFDLNSQQTKTEIILEQMTDGVIAFSVSKQVIHMNKAAMRLLNVTKEYNTYEEIMKKIKIPVKFDDILYMPNYKKYEEKVTISDNTLNLLFVPFSSDRMIPIGVIIVIRNITESIKLDNMRKEFVANVSHELKTPLTSIKGYSETIMDGDLNSEEIKKFAKVINEEANRMDRLVADLLQLSRFDYKKASWNKMMFSLDELAKSSVEKLKIMADQKNHTLDFIIVPETSSKVYADRDAIEQVVINVLTNAIKYTKEGGSIKVYVGSTKNQVYLKVVDNGIGIPEKDLNRIFERFYRVDKARSRDQGGTGLGLSIVKEIVHGNDGSIDIKSEVGTGTEVTIILPSKLDILNEGENKV